MNKEKAKEMIKPGWHKLIDKAYAIVDLLPFAEIKDITTNHSLLQIHFDSALDNSQQYVLDCISYKIERESAKICEECGLNGFRRKDIPHSPCLCTACYTIQYNEKMESVSPQVTNQEPQ